MINNQQSVMQPTFITLHPNEYSQGLRYYTLNELSNNVCVLNKAEDSNLSVSNTITEINESKVFKKNISCESNCKFDGEKCNSNKNWNNKKFRRRCKNPKNINCVKKIIFGIQIHVVVKILNL